MWESVRIRGKVISDDFRILRRQIPGQDFEASCADIRTSFNGRAPFVWGPVCQDMPYTYYTVLEFTSEASPREYVPGTDDVPSMNESIRRDFTTICTITVGSVEVGRQCCP